MDKLIVGWRERVALPDLGVPRIKAKIDTGAESASIDVSGIEPYRDADGSERVRFTVHLSRSKQVDVDAPVCGVRTIRNPGRGGREERRYVITTDLVMGSERWPIEVNLARRTRMRYRMLLGRKALADRCLVDPDESYLQGTPE